MQKNLRQFHNLFIFTNKLSLQVETLTSVRNDLRLKLNVIDLTHVSNLFRKQKYFRRYCNQIGNGKVILKHKQIQNRKLSNLRMTRLQP